MKLTMTNEEMSHYIDVLSGLKESGKLGYAIARNIRLLRTEATEFLAKKAEVFQKFGERKGTTTSVPIEDYKRELGEIPSIQHEVEVYQVDEDTFIGGSLDSAQMAELLWMVKEG